ncbi:MAG: vWA domain-containing protein [Planctomycetota bacterium]
MRFWNRIVVAAAASFLGLASLTPAVAEEKQVPKGPAVDMVFCIDQSGSMDQIIASAKQKIWAIVNEMALARPTPELRIGLIGYGYDPFGAENGFMQVYIDLTDDLDGVYGQLMKLTTDGSTELVGQVMATAMDRLHWNTSPDALKIMFVVGNESADQDQDKERFGFELVAKRSIQSGIVVNTIYGGDVDLAQAEPQWQRIAKLTDGHYSRIDLSGGVVSFATPYDDELAKLNGELNKTYVAFGREGREKQRYMEEQDKAAEGAGPAAAPQDALAQRAECKAGKFYDTDDWDLVEASKAEGFKLEDVKDEDLPEAMRGMTLDQKKEHLAKMGAERGRVKARIQELAAQRDGFIKQEIAKNALDAEAGFDAVVKKAVRAEAEKKGFTFEQK